FHHSAVNAVGTTEIEHGDGLVLPLGAGADQLLDNWLSKMRNDVVELAQYSKILSRVFVDINVVEIGLVVVNHGKFQGLLHGQFLSVFGLRAEFNLQAWVWMDIQRGI